MSKLLVAARLVPVVFIATACPVQDVQAPRTRSKPAPVEADESDERVVKEGEDLYAAAALEKTKPETEEFIGLGSGKPDESNGFCRLYAPKLPQPHCCKLEYGFDSEIASAACGHPVYLGESFQSSCGYFFHDQKTGTPVWMRMSFVEDATAKEAADAHVNRMSVRMKAVNMVVNEVDGVPGAYWSSNDGLAWAWIPGWDRVRRLSWRKTNCSDAGISKVVKSLIDAKQPKQGIKRLALVPKARG